MWRPCFFFCVVLLSSTAASAENTNSKQQPPPPRRVVPQQIVRPAVQQQRMATPGQRSTQPGVPGSGRTTLGSGAPSSPRSQLYDLVRPAPLAPRAGSTMMAVHGPSTRSVPKPANVHHNPAHMVGSAGLQHDHSSFVFRRGDRAFHRRYYAVDGAWYWYDEPVVTNDPSFASAQDPNVLVCEEETDECY